MAENTLIHKARGNEKNTDTLQDEYERDRQVDVIYIAYREK